VIKTVERLLKEEGVIGKNELVLGFEREHGGSINDSFLLTTSKAKFFVKLSRRKDLKDFFKCEQKGLELLRSQSGLKIPEVIAISEKDDTIDILVLEYLEESEAKLGFWESFGRGLATLHQHSSSSFGLNYDNYIGSLKQSNRQYDKWIEFFIHERLEAQFILARDKGYLDGQFGKELNRLFGKLEQLIPEEPPALLHGDLWSGNYRAVGAKQAAIFDPAVYYGHREVDLAMMHLFGGFHRSLFDVYHEAYPLKAGWEERIDLFNLYPLLVHVNLFAGAYTSRAKQVLKKFI